MTEYILLVTWFFGTRPLDSYQVTFASLATCKNAQVELQKEEARLAEYAKPDLARLKERKDVVAVIPSINSPVVPILSSVCVQR